MEGDALLRGRAAMKRALCWFGSHEIRGLSLPGGDRVVFVCDRCGRHQREIRGRDDVVLEPTNIYHHSPTAVWERKRRGGSLKYVVTVSGRKIVIHGGSGKADIPKEV